MTVSEQVHLNMEDRNRQSDEPLVFIGRVIGHYEITDFIGRSGMGEVYRARLNRPVAIKFVSSERLNESTLRRFQQEARMSSALNHPHILTVHEAGGFEGQQYLVVEFIDGGTFRQWVDKNKPSWRQVIDLLTGVADGLPCRTKPEFCIATSNPITFLLPGAVRRNLLISV
jgi:serine/threonine protein kinase